MRALLASDIVYAWEAGQLKHPVDRALLLLALALPACSPALLGSLTIGQRNRQLLLLRQKTLGATAQCFVQCPHCGEKLEFTLDLSAMLPTAMEAPLEPGELSEHIHTLSVDTFTLSFRVPTSIDLASIIHSVDAQEGSHLLIERCVAQATQDDQPIIVASLPENVLQALAEAVIEHDPLAEIECALICPACQQHWTTLFDIVSFFWTELDALAKRLLRDVHTIASAYGWRESDILALSAARRQYYLRVDPLMSNVFSNLAEQSLNNRVGIQPLIPPLFAAAPQLLPDTSPLPFNNQPAALAETTPFSIPPANFAEGITETSDIEQPSKENTSPEKRTNLIDLVPPDAPKQAISTFSLRHLLHPQHIAHDKMEPVSPVSQSSVPAPTFDEPSSGRYSNPRFPTDHPA